MKRIRQDKPALFAVGFVLWIIVLALAADVVVPYDPVSQNLNERLAPPSLAHPFGQDEFGRDLFSRVAHGARISLLVGILSISISLIIGTLVGTVAGYYGGRGDSFLMRLSDIFLAFPSLVLAIGITGVLGPSVFNVVIALGIVGWPGFARVVRAQVLRIRDLDYVEASRSMGAPTIFILRTHVLPNSLGPLIVLATIGIGWAILAEAGLSFIGLGVSPPTPSWGSILASGRTYMVSAPHIVTIPGIVLALMVLSFNLLGDSLRDALDPHLRV